MTRRAQAATARGRPSWPRRRPGTAVATRSRYRPLLGRGKGARARCYNRRQMAERVAASIPRRLAERARTDASDGLEGVLGARIVAYGIDSLLVLIFAVAFVGLATLDLLVQTDGGFTDVSEPALWQ